MKRIPESMTNLLLVLAGLCISYILLWGIIITGRDYNFAELCIGIVLALHFTLGLTLFHLDLGKGIAVLMLSMALCIFSMMEIEKYKYIGSSFLSLHIIFALFVLPSAAFIMELKLVGSHEKSGGPGSDDAREESVSYLPKIMGFYAIMLLISVLPVTMVFFPVAQTMTCITSVLVGRLAMHWNFPPGKMLCLFLFQIGQSFLLNYTLYIGSKNDLSELFLLELGSVLFILAGYCLGVKVRDNMNAEEIRW